MAKKLTQIPDELKCLMMSSTRDTVIIGDEAYELVPLTAGQAGVLIKEITAIISSIAGKILSASTSAKTTPNMSVDKSAVLLDSIRQGLEELVQNGNIIRIVCLALDLEEEQVQKNATIKQLHHFAAMLWKQNFDFSQTNRETEKNFNRLLETLGFGSTDTRVYQWAEVTLHLLADTQAGSPQERIDKTLQIAYELELTDKKPEELKALMLEKPISTQPSESTVVSPEST